MRLDCFYGRLIKLNDRVLQYVTAHDNLYVLFFNFMLGKRTYSRSRPFARACVVD